MIIQHESLEQIVSLICCEAGAAPENADLVASHLVEANLKGHDSHGVGMIPAYVTNILAGRLHPNNHVEVTRDNGAVMAVDGNAGFGQVIGRETTQMAMERVATTGVVCIGLRNSFHLGRIGTYGEMCAAQGYVSVHFVNAVGHAPQVAPFWGRERRVATNPVCCAIPNAQGDPVILDMATSAVAAGKVRVAYMKGEQVPEGALVDHEGRPTTDPSVMYSEPRGAMSPTGGHKGYALAVICELLGGALAGHWTMHPDNPRDGSAINNMLMFVLDPSALGDREAFQRELIAMVDHLHATTPIEGIDQVLVPGDPERLTSAERSVSGIPIDDRSWEGIAHAAEQVGIDRDALAKMTA